MASNTAQVLPRRGTGSAKPEPPCRHRPPRLTVQPTTFSPCQIPCPPSLKPRAPTVTQLGHLYRGVGARHSSLGTERTGRGSLSPGRAELGERDEYQSAGCGASSEVVGDIQASFGERSQRRHASGGKRDDPVIPAPKMEEAEIGPALVGDEVAPDGRHVRLPADKVALVSQRSGASVVDPQMTLPFDHDFVAGKVDGISRAHGDRDSANEMTGRVEEWSFPLSDRRRIRPSSTAASCVPGGSVARSRRCGVGRGTTRQTLVASVPIGV